MKKNTTIILLAAGVMALLSARKKDVVGVGHTTGARIVDNIELMSNCNNSEEVEQRLKEYIESYKGHVVNNLKEAYEWFKEIYGEDLDYDDVHFGDTQYSTFSLDEDNEYGWIPSIRVIIEEVVVDSGSDDYCYIVSVEEE